MGSAEFHIDKPVLFFCQLVYTCLAQHIRTQCADEMYLLISLENKILFIFFIFFVNIRYKFHIAETDFIRAIYPYERP